MESKLRKNKSSLVFNWASKSYVGFTNFIVLNECISSFFFLERNNSGFPNTEFHIVINAPDL
jgi:hypothetical protein